MGPIDGLGPAMGALVVLVALAGWAVIEGLVWLATHVSVELIP